MSSDPHGQADLLIRGARILDGSGGPDRRGDVAVRGDRILALDDDLSGPADRVIEADGRVVCPGFIDMHSHVDTVLDDFPRADGMVRQGVTTILTGNCGISPFPGRWPDLNAFRTDLRDHPLALNVAPMIGHGAVRSAAMDAPDQPPTGAELQTMTGMVEAAMRHGAHGMSTGLIYDPGRFAGTEEIVTLARVVAQHGGLYASHIRGEADTLTEAVAEALEIGRRSGAAVQVSHHKAKRRRNWGTVAATLAMIDDAAADGLDVMLDAYPYDASSTSLWAYLPSWARAGELQAHGAELPAPLRARLIADLEVLYPGCSSGNGAVTDLNDLVIGHVDGPAHLAAYERRRLHEVASSAGLSQADLLLDLLMSAERVQIIDHAMSPEDVRAVLDHPRCMLGSDARLIHPDMPGTPHPRNFGAFTRFLTGAGARMPLTEAVSKCTGLPSRRLGWHTPRPGSIVRGILAPGAAADLLMFDPERVRDHATFEDPKQYGTGMDLILVNGRVVIDDDEDTQAAAGRFLLRGGGHP